MSPLFPSSQKDIAFKCLEHNENCPEYSKPAAEIAKQRFHWVPIYLDPLEREINSQFLRKIS